MSKSNTCADCAFFKANDNDLVKVGSCMRFPPTPHPMPQQGIVGAGGYGLAGLNPPVESGHWCGEFSGSSMESFVNARSNLLDFLNSKLADGLRTD